MQTQAQPTATKGAHTALQRCLHGAPLAESIGADFKKGTWTFKISPHHQVATGHYVLLPAVVARLALSQEAAEANACLQLLPPSNVKARFHSFTDGVALEERGDNGYEATYYRDHLPNDRTANYWHPAHWRGHEQRRDMAGTDWRTMKTYVQDDFGMLVEVPA